MKLKRVKGAKGKRWKKGQSCVSNPENSSHREAAKGNFFQKLDGESGLTVEALAKHTAALEVGSKLYADPEDDKSIGKSFNTFATNFTTCTIPAFEKFFRSFTVDSELQTRMLAIHAAAQEYIQEANLNETSTAYMCALMVSLEGVKDSVDDVTATLSLIAKVIRKVNKDILRAKFGEYSTLFDDIFTAYSTTNNSKLLINIIGCLSILLRAQDEVQWTYPFTLNLFQKIIAFSTHENPDVRRAAQYNASAVLKGSSFLVVSEPSPTGNKEEEGGASEDGKNEKMEAEESCDKEEKRFEPTLRFHPAAESCGKFVLTNIKLASENMNGKATLYLLIFLQQIITCLPKKMLEQCCSVVLGIMHIGDGTVNSRALKVFGALFYTEAGVRPRSALTLDTNEALVNALTSSGGDSKATLRVIPSMNDPELSGTWMDVVAAGIVHLTRVDSSAGIGRFCSWMKLLPSFWKSDSEVVHEKVWHVMDYLFDECINPQRDQIPHHANQLLEAFHQVEKCLSLQYEMAWPHVFSSLALFLLNVGPRVNPDAMVPCLKNLASMADTPDLRGKKQLEKAIGAAISGMGPEEVMKVIPLQITGDIKEDETNLWILPILKKYVKNARLRFYNEYFLHLIEKCEILLSSLKTQGKQDSLLGKTYRIIERQMWGLFPSFADGAVDIEKEVTKGFVGVIRENIRGREDIRIDVMAGLRHLLSGSSRNSGLAMLHGKELLPALFGIYMMRPRDKYPKGPPPLIDPGQRLAALSTIEAFFRILRSDKIPVFFGILMEKFSNTVGQDEFTLKSLLTLARAFLPYLSPTSLDIIYKKAAKDIASRDSYVQKHCYRILEDILTTDSSVCKLYIEERIDSVFSLLFSSTRSVIPTAKGARLRCLRSILSHLRLDTPLQKRNDVLKQVLEEAIKCCGPRNSVSTRKAAFSLISEVGKTLQKMMELSYEETFMECFHLLPSLSTPSDLSANTILALMALFYHYKDLISASVVEVTVKDVSSLLSSRDRSVIKSCLEFIRMVFAFFPPPVMSDHVDITVTKMTEMPEEIRKKFRLKIRDIFASLIRKFGADRIKSLLPPEDRLLKMVGNVVKKDNRRRRLKRGKEEQGEDDSEEENVDEALTSLDAILGEIDKDIENDERVPKDERKSKALKRKSVLKKKTWIIEEEDEIVDLLDVSSGQFMTTKKPKKKQLRFEEKQPRTEEEKYGFKMDQRTKKFIITNKDDYEEDKKEEQEDDDKVDFSGILMQPQQTDDKSQKPVKRKRANSEGSDDSAKTARKSTSGSVSGKDRKKKKFDYGSEYRSKKAGGDIVKKSGVMPYAYVQFSKDKLNKRKKAKYAGQFRSLVKGARKGAARGSKMKAKKK